MTLTKCSPKVINCYLRQPFQKKGFMKLLFYAISLSLTFYSCNIINPDEKEPAYLQIEGYTMDTEGGQGTASDKISEMWTYANDNILSISTLGSQNPVLNQGPTRISIRPGIKNNGASDMRIYYPFYQPFDTVINFSPLSYHKINARFKYYSSVVIDASRDFETGSNFTQVVPYNQGFFDVVNDPAVAFEGNRCAKAYLTGSNTFLYFRDQNEIEIERGNTVFLEMNYSCNQPFTIGIASVSGGQTYTNDMVVMSATANGTDVSWNKIYIDLGPVGLLLPNASAHYIYVKCNKTGGDLPVIYLDNLKTVMWP